MPLVNCELLKFVCNQYSCQPNFKVWAPRFQVRLAAISRFWLSSVLGTLLTPMVVKLVINISEKPGFAVTTPGIPTCVRLCEGKASFQWSRFHPARTDPSRRGENGTS